MPDLGDFATVLGRAALGGAGPSGRASMASILNQERRITARQDELASTNQRAADALMVESVREAMNTPQWATVPQQDRDILTGQAERAAQRMGLSSSFLQIPIQQEAEQVKTRAIQTLDEAGNPVTRIVEDKPGQVFEAQPKQSLVNVDFNAGTGVTKSDTSGAIIEAVDDRNNQENFIRGINQVIDFTRSDDYVGGFTGSALQAINSGLQQAAQVFSKKSDPLIKKGNLNIDTLEDDLSRENVTFLRKAAISKDVRDSAILRLSYILAKRVDPNGRISDADVRLARDILTGSADQASAILQLENVRDLTTRELNTKMKNVSGALGLEEDERFNPIDVQGSGGKKRKDLMTTEELFNDL